MRAAWDFISPEAAGAPIYLYREGWGKRGPGHGFGTASGKSVLKLSLVVIDLSRQKICKI